MRPKGRARGRLRGVAIDALIDAAALAHSGEEGLAAIKASYAKRIFEKANIKKPYEYRLIYCRKCKKISPIGISRRIRLRKGRIVFRCEICDGVYRKMVSKS